MADFQRQLDIIDPKKLVYPVTCIGLGGIGSFTAMTLRKMGFHTFMLWDHDFVEPHNVPSQAYGKADIESAKAEALAAHLEACLNERLETNVYTRRADEFASFEGIVIAGVDSMKSRAAIWKAVKKSRSFVPLFVDGRIGIEWDAESERVVGEWIEVFTIKPSILEDRELYESHLFPDEESDELRCTAQAVVYVGGFISSFIAANVKKWIMGDPYPRYLLFDVLTYTMLHSSL
jgi:molybdopterin/thiamine biosynthesis adenylyltransferase